MKKGAPGWWARNAFVPKRCPSVNSARESLGSYRAIICVVRPNVLALCRRAAYSQDILPKNHRNAGARNPSG